MLRRRGRQQNLKKCPEKNGSILWISSMFSCAELHIWLFSRYFSRMSSIHVLPVETIFQILESLSPSSVINVMLTDKTLHTLGARVLYSDVSVVGNPARLFFTTISSRTVLATLYASFTKRLTYVSTTHFDQFLSFTIFCESLMCLKYIRVLTIMLAPGHGESMRLVLQRYGIARQSTSMLSAARLNDFDPKYSILALPSLHTLRLGGQIELLDLALHRPLTELSFTTTLNYHEIDTILNTLAISSSCSTILSFSIRLPSSVEFDIIFWAVSERLPNLRSFVVEQPKVHPLVSLSSFCDLWVVIYSMLMHYLLSREFWIYLQVPGLHSQNSARSYWTDLYGPVPLLSWTPWRRASLSASRNTL